MSKKHPTPLQGEYFMTLTTAPPGLKGVIDLRSDTVTKPTPAMRTAMAKAAVGDDVYGEDPTVNRLEELAAERFGQAAGLFLPSGTMGNQVAVLTHTQRGDEVLLEAEAHIYYYEVGGLAALAGVQPRLIAGERGRLDPELVERALRAPNIHFPRPSLLCLENTHNRGGGTVMDCETMQGLVELAHDHGLTVHLDGARIFNAACFLGTDVRDLTAGVDSIMFCLSKGLCAPIGSLLVGSRPFIARARKMRKLLGGGMRQAGVVAAAGIVALNELVDRLSEDHTNARRLAQGLAEIAGLQSDPQQVQTNIVLCQVTDPEWDGPALAECLAGAGVLVNAFGPDQLRFVTHHDVGAIDIERALNIIRGVLG
jgi:threonine aldolase